MSNSIYGQWRIVGMEQWDQDFIDAEVPGYITFSSDDMGEFQFGYVHGILDCHFSKRNEEDIVEFSWEGNDEMDSAFGRGYATVKDGKLYGNLFFHQGDNSEFIAIRKEK